jgi:hypothetical protein
MISFTLTFQIKKRSDNNHDAYSSRRDRTLIVG